MPEWKRHGTKYPKHLRKMSKEKCQWEMSFPRYPFQSKATGKSTMKLLNNTVQLYWPAYKRLS